MAEFFQQVSKALHCCRIESKKSAIEKITAWVNSPERDAHEFIVPTADIAQRTPDPGRPALPILVHPSEVPRRRLGSQAGRTGLIHAVAHIEFNAVNLALDAAYRFRGMPVDYYRDWIRVASDEARHFEMLVARLHELGSDYGAMPAHGGMWEMAVATDYDVGVRMALVPRVMEARGLDVTPGMIKKLSQHGDHATVAILEQILFEEIDHVRIGNHWFKSVCEKQGLEPVATFSQHLRKHGRIALRGPFNREARLEAGFTEQELAELAELELEFKQSFESEPA